MSDIPNAGPDSQPSGQPGYQGPNLWRDASEAARKVADWLRPPAEVAAHIRAARVEVLKAIRAMIDYRIDRLTRVDQHGTKINVE